ncbi:hypothetical protein ACOACO_08300 [Nocardioides sp. CPCC 205120]|uniref:hypothetical protein n=1 Tax=Nocardioides sp. CPCC 205120 TaxID=3406462 RepID=UPI003B50905E
MRPSSPEQENHVPSKSDLTPPESWSRVPPESTKERTGRYVALIVMPFLMVTMMFATYMGTMHDPTPTDVPVAVVGDGASADAAVEALEALPDDVVATSSVGSRAEALDLVEAQEVAGVLVPPDGPGQEAQVLTAAAGGAQEAAMVQQTLAGVAAGEGWAVATEDLAPLPEGDASGTLVLFAAMGMMLAGYVPLSILLLGAPHLLSVRRFLPLLLGWSVALSTIIWTLLGPVVGAVDGHLPTFLGVGVLAIAAVGLAQLLFTKVMGALAVLPGMLLWVVFGMPSSNLALPVDSMPGFFGLLHGLLPLPAAGEALRAFLYFDGAGALAHVAVLAAWVVGALGLCLLKERRGGVGLPGEPAYDDADTPLPALAGGPLRTKRIRYAAAALFPMSIVVMVVGLMGTAMHEPEVRGMPIGVVADSPQAAEQFVSGAQDGLGDVADLTVVDSVDELVDQVETKELVGGYVLPRADGSGSAVYSAAGAGASQKTVVESIVTGLASGVGVTPEAIDIAPLTDDDTMGSNSLYVGMSWVLAGFLIMAVMRGGAPQLRTLRELLPFLGGWAVGMAIWLWFLFDVLIGAVNGHALALVGAGSVTIFATSLVTAVFTRTLGLAAIVPVMVVLLLAGVPASGGGLSVYMVPDVFRSLQDVLPLPAAVDIARSLVYFDGSGLGADLLVIGCWGAVGLVLNLGVDRLLVRREPPVIVPRRDQVPARDAVEDGGTSGRADGRQPAATTTG